MQIRLRQSWLYVVLNYVTSINSTVEPRYKEVRYNKTLLFNKVTLLVPALYISVFVYPDVMFKVIFMVPISSL